MQASDQSEEVGIAIGETDEFCRSEINVPAIYIPYPFWISEHACGS